MSKEKPRSRGLGHFGRFILVGFFTVAPLWVTWLVFDFVVGILVRTGRPLLYAAARAVSNFSPTLASWMLESAFEQVVALIIVLAALYAVGVFATIVIGRKLIGWFESLMARLPLVQTIYGGTKRLLHSLRTPPATGQRVVLIAFPNDRMKTIGMVMRTIRDSASGRELAVVYVPTAPNPTSGYIEIVPVDDVIFVDWSVEEAMSFIMTGGTTSPDTVQFTKEPGTPPAREPATPGAQEGGAAPAADIAPPAPSAGH
ncbi:MAG: DUF502 domain-containing protein [Burkholderiaceae bacterium]